MSVSTNTKKLTVQDKEIDLKTVFLKLPNLEPFSLNRPLGLVHFYEVEDQVTERAYTDTSPTPPYPDCAIASR